MLYINKPPWLLFEGIDTFLYDLMRKSKNQGKSKMATSALFVMDLKGKIIISRNYRGDVPMSVSER